MAKFFYFDVETANMARQMCQIGYVVEEDGVIVDSQNYLVKPDMEDTFEWQAVNVHGITFEDVQDEFYFPDIFEKIKKYFNGEYILVAHNAAFDIGVLKKEVERYLINFDFKNVKYLCTMYALKKLVPNQINYKLADLTKRNNLEYKNHHDALSDVKMMMNIVKHYSKTSDNFLRDIIRAGYKLKNFLK